MNDNTASAVSDQWAAFRGRFITVAAILAALLALLWLMGYGPGGSACKAGPSTATAPAAPAAPTAPATDSPQGTPAPGAATATSTTVPQATPAPVVTTAAAEPAATTAATPAGASGQPRAVLYFEVGKADLPAEADKSLADVVAALKADAAAKVQLSGFHDPSGNPAQNEELAHNRARAVRAALEAAGIARDRVVMAKPAVTTGSGDAREARRVEVTVL